MEKKITDNNYLHWHIQMKENFAEIKKVTNQLKRLIVTIKSIRIIS